MQIRNAFYKIEHVFNTIQFYFKVPAREEFFLDPWNESPVKYPLFVYLFVRFSSVLV